MSCQYLLYFIIVVSGRESDWGNSTELQNLQMDRSVLTASLYVKDRSDVISTWKTSVSLLILLTCKYCDISTTYRICFQ